MQRIIPEGGCGTGLGGGRACVFPRMMGAAPCYEMTAPGSQIWALTEFQTKCISPFPLLAPGWCGLITQKETTMRKFETLLLLSPELSADARDGILNDLKAIVEREKGTMEDIDPVSYTHLTLPTIFRV